VLSAPLSCIYQGGAGATHPPVFGSSAIDVDEVETRAGVWFTGKTAYNVDYDLSILEDQSQADHVVIHPESCTLDPSSDEP